MKREENYKINCLPIHMLTIAFIVLKLCGVIDWSWWCVLSPTLILVIIIGVVVALVILHKEKIKHESYHEVVEAYKHLKEKMEALQKKIDEIHRRNIEKNDQDV